MLSGMRLNVLQMFQLHHYNVKATTQKPLWKRIKACKLNRVQWIKILRSFFRQKGFFVFFFYFPPPQPSICLLFSHSLSKKEGGEVGLLFYSINFSSFLLLNNNQKGKQEQKNFDQLVSMAKEECPNTSCNEMGVLHDDEKPLRTQNCSLSIFFFVSFFLSFLFFKIFS